MYTKKYVELAPQKLRANPANVRTHSKKQIADLAEVISKVGFIAPIVCDAALSILAGHARWQAAKLLGLTLVPVIVVAGLSEAKRRLFVLADNKFSERAGWDFPALANELSGLTQLLAGEGLDIGLTGFESPEIDRLMIDYIDPEQDPADEVPQTQRNPVSRLGDLFDLGGHRLLCGDARKEAALRRLMGRSRARMVFADPPYNVRVSSVQGRGRIRHREFVAASGELSFAEYTSFLERSLSVAAKFSLSGSLHYFCIDWRHIRELQEAAEKAHFELVNVCVWVKTNSGQGSFTGLGTN
jgi:hypothetical protein